MSREKGMISLVKLAEWRERMSAERDDLKASAEAVGNIFPPVWPSRVEVLEYTTVERTVEGHHGYAPTVSPLDGYSEARDDARASAFAFDAWYSAWRFGSHPDYEALSVVDFFVPFGSRRSNFDRAEWKAGSIDFAETGRRVSAIPILLDQVEAIAEALGGLARFQYWDVDYYPLRSRSWVADDATTVETLEYKGLTVSEAVDDVPVRSEWFERTSPGGDDEMWDAINDEMQARRVVAEALLASLSDKIFGAPDVRFWAIGSQTRRRGF